MPSFLVATPQLQDPNFKKSVVLLLEHTNEGAMGFVVNRLAGMNLRSVLPPSALTNCEGTTTDEIPEDLPVWFGGPVETGTGVILHAETVSQTAMAEAAARRQDCQQPGDDSAQADRQVGEGIVLSSNQKALNELLAYGRLLKNGQLAGHPASHYVHPYRFVVGYSGWGAGQLDEELRLGAWVLVPVSEELLFNSSWSTLWDRCLASVGVSPNTIAPSEHSYLH